MKRARLFACAEPWVPGSGGPAWQSIRSGHTEHFVKRGLPLLHLLDPCLAERDEAGPAHEVAVRPLAGAPLDQLAQVVVELQHLEDACATPVAGGVAGGAALGALELGPC